MIARRLKAALAAVLVVFAAQGAGPDRRTEAALDIIDRLVNFVFDSHLSTGGLTQALVYRDRSDQIRSFADVRNYNISAAFRLHGSAQAFQLEHRPAESPYWERVETPGLAAEFIRHLGQEFATELQAPSAQATRTRTPLEKAVAGRDLFQAFSLLYRAAENSEDASAQAMAMQIENLLARLFVSVRLTETEYRELCALRPTRLPRGFTSRVSFSLEEDYLPRRVVGEDESWLSVAGDGRRTRHFRAYGGRAFVRVYVRSPGMSHRQLKILWSELYTMHGERLHNVAVDEDVPKGLETLLVRTMGVFLADGTFRDSKWPEEVIIRQFKYPGFRIDNTTSDFSGTVFFQYRMSTESLLRNPESLGLRRVHDDDPQYFGFFGDVVDVHHSYSDTVTTMRSNCIACHSELFYGLNTVFSFERDPELMNGRAGDDSIAKFIATDVYRLQTPAYRRLEDVIVPTATSR
jgi:hypothetical protein